MNAGYASIQPASNIRTPSAQSCEAQESCACGGSFPPAGNKLQSDTDYKDPDLEFTRRYISSSGMDARAAMGSGWGHNYSRYIMNPQQVKTGNTNYHAEFRRADGTYERFINQGGDVYVSSVDPARIIRTQPDNTWVLQTGTGVEKYDSGGRLVEVSRYGSTPVTLAYDTKGRLSTVTDGYGRSLVLAYNPANGLLATVTTPAGQVYAYSYETYTSGPSTRYRLASVQKPDGRLQRYLYEDPRFPANLTGIVDERGVRVGTFTYDAYGRLVSESRTGVSGSTALTYNPDDSVTVTGPGGDARTLVYTDVKKLRRLQRVTFSDGTFTEYTYDSNGLLQSKRDRGGQTTTYTYYPDGTRHQVT